jgi:tRNA (mo5U34)-methyltransferase
VNQSDPRDLQTKGENPAAHPTNMTREEKKDWVSKPPGWMYEFDLGDGVTTPLLLDELRSIHQTREQMIIPVIDQYFPHGLAGKCCLDVGCNEGYFSHLLFQRGAVVKGVDVREANIDRARKVQAILGYDPHRLVFQVEDFLDNLDEPNTYDLTFFLGLLYHLENPMGAIRSLHRITRTLSIIETQLTRQVAPVTSGWGQAGVTLELPASLAIYSEPDMDINNLAASNSLSLIPNAAAVHQFLSAAGFKQVIQLTPEPGANSQYVNNDRGIFLALK